MIFKFDDLLFWRVRLLEAIPELGAFMGREALPDLKGLDACGGKLGSLFCLFDWYCFAAVLLWLKTGWLSL